MPVCDQRAGPAQRLLDDADLLGVVDPPQAGARCRRAGGPARPARSRRPWASHGSSGSRPSVVSRIGSSWAFVAVISARRSATAAGEHVLVRHDDAVGRVAQLERADHAAPGPDAAALLVARRAPARSPAPARRPASHDASRSAACSYRDRCGAPRRRSADPSAAPAARRCTANGDAAARPRPAPPRRTAGRPRRRSARVRRSNDQPRNGSSTQTVARARSAARAAPRQALDGSASAHRTVNPRAFARTRATWRARAMPVSAPRRAGRRVRRRAARPRRRRLHRAGRRPGRGRGDQRPPRRGYPSGTSRTTPTARPRAVAEHLRELGIDAEDGDVVTSAQAAADLVVGRVPPGSAVLVVGGDGLAEALRDARAGAGVDVRRRARRPSSRASRPTSGGAC